MIKKISKDYIPLEITDTEKEKGVSQSDELPKYFPSFCGFSADELGRIYAQTLERQPDGVGFYYDVFDTEGKCIAKIHLNSLPCYWKNGKM